MRLQLLRSVILTVVMLVILGVFYPLAGWLVSQSAFHSQANGSIGPNGSSLIGQPWGTGTAINPLWFNGRPDSDNPLVVNGANGESGAASLGPRSKVLVSSVRAFAAQWKAVGVTPTVDLVTTSGSGIDPDISPLDARVQIPMIEKSRHLSAATLRGLIARETHSAQFGFLGSSYINVLEINEALAKLVANTK
jgi:K+-transporting ATPase ATPase C chain